jgi:hypothetical protein
MQTLCGSIERGGGRLCDCMSEHRSQLSYTCKLAIADRMLERKSNRVRTGSASIVGLPPEKWSSLKYGLWPDGGLRNAEEETQGGRDCRQAAAD